MFDHDNLYDQKNINSLNKTFILIKKMNDKYKVKIDPENVRYNRFRKAFKEDIVQKLECEDYEKIIE